MKYVTARGGTAEITPMNLWSTSGSSQLMDEIRKLSFHKLAVPSLIWSNWGGGGEVNRIGEAKSCP
jgi:hypothetical protein